MGPPRSAALSALLLVAATACSGGKDATDGPVADGPTGGLDAPTGHPDAPTGQPDALTGHPDAAAGHPDAATGHPDAPTGQPDAPTTQADAPITGSTGLHVVPAQAARPATSSTAQGTPSCCAARIAPAPSTPASTETSSRVPPIRPASMP